MTHIRDKDPLLLSGSTPGLLDPSQRSRLLRTPSCNLFFAAFDPLTANTNNFPNLSSLNIGSDNIHAHVNPETNTNSSGKRIVIETDAENGTCSWRFVPRARFEDHLSGDEGHWPRVVEFCGRMIRMTQDQWDLHKLDPEYDCFVRKFPSLTMIRRISPNTPTSHATTAPSSPATPQQTFASMENFTPTPKAKRDISPADIDSESPRKRRKGRATRVKPSPSFESDKMAVDEDIFHVTSTSLFTNANQAIANGKKRRRVFERLREASTSDAEEVNGKIFEGYNDSFHRSDIETSELDVPFTPVKKVRTHSPGAVRREIEQKRINREKRRKAGMEARLKLRRDGMERAFWDGLGVPAALHDPGVYPDLEETYDSGNDFGDASNDSGTEREDEDDAERLAKIEDSRRKLADLEKDKPLWEESARKRQQKEEEEEQLRQRARVMRERSRQQEHIRTARRQLEEKWEQEQREREREAHIREQRGRMFILAPRDILQWGVRLSLDRYLQAAADFDAAKFSTSRPITFASVPWPMLPASFSVQDVEWKAVETFFAKVQRLLTPTEFKELVKKCRVRFHPDRWRNRGLLATVKNDVERDLLEVAGSTVAQAITPLWKDVTEH